MSSTDESAAAMAFYQVLKNHVAKDVLELVASKRENSNLPSDGSVIEIDSTATTLEAAATLWKYNILSAPVWDKTKEKYLGFFDMRDILSAVVAASKSARQTVNNKEEEDEASLLLEQYNISMVKELENMSLTKQDSAGSDDGDEDDNVKITAVKVPYLAKRNPLPTTKCNEDTSLLELSKLLSRKCHRVPLYDANGRIAHILSQSALVKFLAAKTKKDESLLSETLGKSSLDYKKEVLSVKDTAPAYEAFELLDSRGLSGIAVVEEETGALVGNTSARDIRLAANAGGSICMSSMDTLSYLAELRLTSAPIGTGGKERHPTCLVRETETISHILQLLAKTGYHRVFVVDTEKKPIGVVSVADMIRFALEQGSTGE